MRVITRVAQILMPQKWQKCGDSAGQETELWHQSSWLLLVVFY